MTPDQAHRLQDLFMDARKTARATVYAPNFHANLADDAAVKAFMDAVAEMVTHD